MKEIVITLIITLGLVALFSVAADAQYKTDRLEACGKHGVTCEIVTHVIQK